MNAERRKTLSELAGQIADIKTQLETLRDDEQDYRDNMPESFASGEKGDKADNAISELDSAISSLDDAESSIGSAVE